MKLAIVLCLLGSSGCSVIGMTRPTTMLPLTSNEEQSDEKCTSSTAFPVVDTLIAVGAGAATVGALVNAQNAFVQSTGNPTQDQQNLDKTNGQNYGLAVVAGAASIAYIASAAYGYHSAHQCSEVKARIESREQAELMQRIADKKEQEETARQDAIRAQQAAQQERNRIEAERKRVREQEYAKSVEEREVCNKDKETRLRHNGEFLLHQQTSMWVRENCGIVARNKTNKIPYPDNEGTIHFRYENEIVGYELSCPIKGRPSHTDGSKLTDKDIEKGNLATQSDDMSMLEQDNVLTTGMCSKYDNTSFTFESRK